MAIVAATAVIGCFYTLLPAEISVEAGAVTVEGFCGTSLHSRNGSVSYYIGAIPIKTVNVQQVQRRYLVPCGTPFGIKLRTEGVMAVSVTEDSPAEKAGIQEGDIIIKVNGVVVRSNSDISSAIQLCPEKCEIILCRGDSERLITLVPYETCGIYKAGIWVRDSAAGIGTMSYYDPETGEYGGLGHAVSDVTTGELMPLASGEITAADINGVVKGEAGEPGELRGALISGEVIGSIEQNTPSGIFGTMQGYSAVGDVMPVAFRQEVQTGKATILTTISGTQPEEYDIEIEHISVSNMESSKSMVIRITDPDLLESTGGIICGMSGSPILQNGMLVGAVTHVFLNDPERGYAIFCETMLDEAV